MPQFLIHEFKFCFQFDLIDQFLSSNIKDTVYYPNVSHVYIYFTIQRFIFLRSSMFWAISYYSISSCPFTFIYSSIVPKLFFGSQTPRLLLFPCHEPTTIQCSIVLSHCGFMFLFKLFLFKLSRYILRDSGLKRFFNIYIKHELRFYKQAFVMVNSVIIRKFFTTTIIMPAFLKFLFWMSSDWLHFFGLKFHYGSLSGDAVNIHYSTIFYVVNYTAECARGDWSSDSQVRWGRRKAVYPCLYQQLCKRRIITF